MGRAIHIFIDGEIKLKYLCYSEFHAWKQSSGISYLFYLKRNEQNTSIWNTKMQLQNLIFFNYVFLTLFKIILFKCLHLLINSDFLLNNCLNKAIIWPLRLELFCFEESRTFIYSPFLQLQPVFSHFVPVLWANERNSVIKTCSATNIFGLYSSSLV